MFFNGRKQISKILTALFWSLCLSGCGVISPKEPDPVLPEMEPVSLAVMPTAEEYALYYEERNYKLSLYEPPEGCYLGAYILSNKKINFDMNNFETLANKKHAVYLYNMDMGDHFPITWVLDCISNTKTPYIVVSPKDESNPFDRQSIEEMASAFGELYVPMFVEFYPDPRAKGYNPEEYIEFFRYARRIFRDKASNVAFVWAVGSENVAGCKSYYPGDTNVDWVGLHVYEKILNGSYVTDFSKSVEYLYFEFQKIKPIVISQLAISHYSSSDHVYMTETAANEVKRVYQDILLRYPRIKMVNYMDFNAIEISSGNDVKDNFSITDGDEVLNAYRWAVAQSGFLTEAEVSSTGDRLTQMMMSPFSAVKLSDQLYASEKSFAYELNMKGLTNGKTINGQEYYSLDIMEKNRLRIIEKDEDGKRIMLKYP